MSADIPWDEIEELITENYAARRAGTLPDEWFPPDAYYFVNAPPDRRNKFYRDGRVENISDNHKNAVN